MFESPEDPYYSQPAPVPMQSMQGAALLSDTYEMRGVWGPVDSEVMTLAMSVKPLEVDRTPEGAEVRTVQDTAKTRIVEVTEEVPAI